MLLATDIALDGPTSPSLHGAEVGQVLLHPTEVVDALADGYSRWREVIDTPLENWTRDEFLQKRNIATSLLQSSPSVAPCDIDPAPSDAAELTNEHRVVQYLGLFAGFQ